MTKIAEKTAQWLSENKPMVLYRKPGSQTVRAMFADGSDRKASEGPGFIFHPFASEDSYFLADAGCEVSECIPEQKDFHLSTPELSINSDAKSQFETIVAKAVATLKTGSFAKVVLSRKEAFETESDAFSIFERLLSTYPTAFVSLWNHPKTGCWIGATPERLISGSGSSFETMSLAGTQAYQGEESVEWPKKEREEQRLVTDYIWNTLEPFCSEVELSAPFTQKAGNLLHIRTTISGNLESGVSLQEVADALHPTPAICGMPKEKALDFILENEGYDREFYAGYLGEIAEDRTDLFVNLRCMKFHPGSAELFMGCGITADSDPEKEFFETVNKSLTIRKVL